MSIFDIFRKRKANDMSMFDTFGKGIYDTVIEDGLRRYREDFERTIHTTEEIKSPVRADFWNARREFYKGMTEEEKDVFFDVIGIIMLDTISHAFALLDGKTFAIDGSDFEADITIDGEDMLGLLQDSVLAYAEGYDKWEELYFGRKARK